MNPNKILEAANLTPYYNVFCLMGIFLSAYCAQLFGRGAFGYERSEFAQRLRRYCTIIMGLAFAWALTYASSHRWQPWPPDLLIILAVNGYLVSTIVAAANRGRVWG